MNPATQVLQAVNAARVSAGCSALAADAALAAEAAEHSADMRDRGFVAARSMNRGDRTAVVATGGDPAAVADDWLADSTLLDCALTRAGVGTTGGYWTLLAA